MGACPLIACPPRVRDVQIAIIFHMARLTKHSKLCMRVLRIVIEMGSSKPDGVVASVHLPPAYFALLSTTDLTDPSCLLFAGFGLFVPIGRLAFFVPGHSRIDVPA